MTRRTIILLLAVALLAALAFWLISSPNPSTPVTPLPKVETKQEEQPRPTDQNGLPQPIFKETPSEEVLQQKIEEGRQGQIAQIKDFAAAFDTSINFWGKVVDEKGDPVPGALVKMGTADKPFQTGTRHERTTDASGLFSVLGAKGLSISVTVSKDGFYQTPRSRGQVSYAHPSGNKEPLPTSNTPAVFELRKMGEIVPLVRVEQSARIPKDGTPATVDLMTGRFSPSGNFRMEAWTEAPEGGQKFTWRCRVTVPGGGLVERKGQFDFEAPEDGYEESVELGMSRDAKQWASQQQRDYFVKLPDGRFARINFRMIAGGNHYFVMESFLNPTPGSRNLEYDPKQASGIQ
jgi:hypothetical protein